MHRPKQLLLKLAGAALIVTLTACSALIPPQPIGDPLGLDGLTVTSVDLYWAGEPEALATADGPVTDREAFVITITQMIRDMQDSRPTVLPPSLPDLNLPPVDPAREAMHDRLLAVILGSGNDAITPPRDMNDLHQMRQSQLAAALLAQKQEMEQRRQELIDERKKAVRERYEQILLQQMQRSLQLMQERNSSWELPMTFHVPASDGMDIPGIAASAINSMRQEIGLASLRVIVPEGASTADLPETYEIRGYAITVTATQRDSSGTVRPLARLAQSQILETPLVLTHTGDGNYELDGDSLLANFSYSAAASDLARALIDGNEIYGSIDIALNTFPQLSPEFAVEFTLSAGEAILRF